MKWIKSYEYYTPMERLSPREHLGMDVNVEIYFWWKLQLLQDNIF